MRYLHSVLSLTPETQKRTFAVRLVVGDLIATTIAVVVVVVAIADTVAAAMMTTIAVPPGTTIENVVHMDVVTITDLVA